MRVIPLPDEPMDVILEGGLVFDGTGAKPRRANVGIRGDTVVAITEGNLARGPRTRTIDCRGRWVTPGFIDLHTHYDAEIEVAPGLDESVRHGVTTCVLGSCSLSLAVGEPDDLADMFCRVEAIPDDVVRPILKDGKDWNSHREYIAHLESLPLGPNVASFVGHSALRTHVMGLHRALEKGTTPTVDELQVMGEILDDALDAGYLGLSVQTLPWDKMGGSGPTRSRPLPSTFARWSEVRALAKRLRRRGAVFQGVPNISTKWNAALFLLESVGLLRPALKTTIISMMDLKGAPGLHRVIGAVSSFFNRVLGADFRWQALPEIFDLWADGIDLVVFEEFGAGAAALHLADAEDRKKLLDDPKYRARFRREWTSPFLPKAFHRDFSCSTILACPDATVVGKSFADVAKERGMHVADAFLDLVVAHGDALRWYTVMANEDEAGIREIMMHPDVLVGFSDAGAHLRQMAHYNFPLRLLRLVKDALDRGLPFLTPEAAIHRLTGELGDWLGIDAGHLAVGKRADVVVVNPDALDARTELAVEAPVAGYGGFQRLVRRNAGIVEAVFVGGQQAIAHDEPCAALGTERLGRFLTAKTARHDVTRAERPVETPLSRAA